jgi:hypothetical protein
VADALLGATALGVGVAAANVGVLVDVCVGEGEAVGGWVTASAVAEVIGVLVDD